MSQQELLKKVVRVLDDLKIAYMATGSVVSSIQGEPRSSHDIDVVVQMNEHSIKALVEAFSTDEYYLSQTSIMDALNSKTMFNLLDTVHGDKVDFWILTDEPFDRSRFPRKRLVEVVGLCLYISAPEDTILMKLRWSELAGGSVRQFNDAPSVYEMQKENLDMAYLKEWAHRLGIEPIWSRLLTTANAI